MSTISHSASKPLIPDGKFCALFPPTVAVMEQRAPGDPRVLHPAEAEYVARAVPKRVAEFAAGRACARAALARFGICEPIIRAAPDRQPVWPEGFVGSITHTAGFCAAAAARRTSVLALGLDTEVVGAPSEDLWPVISRSEELSWVQSLPAPDRSAAITLLFAAKEAVYKCQYPLVGEWLDFHDLRVQADDWGQPSGTFTVNAARNIRFAERVALPALGRYLFHERFVSATLVMSAQ